MIGLRLTDYVISSYAYANYQCAPMLHLIPELPLVERWIYQWHLLQVGPSKLPERVTSTDCCYA